jgi:hypothetical protein
MFFPCSYNVQEVLRRAHKAADASLSQLWFDVGLATMDLIAFWGYFVIPLTYFYRDEEIYHNFLYGYYPGTRLAITPPYCTLAFLWVSLSGLLRAKGAALSRLC